MKHREGKVKPHRKNSIRIKITIWLFVFAMSIVLASWLICNLLVTRFYKLNTERSLEETYYSCDELFKDKESSDDTFGALYGYIDNELNAIVYIIDEESMQVYSSMHINREAGESIRAILNITDFSKFEGEKKYEIYMHTDRNTHGEYYDLVGRLSNNNIIILRASVAPIDSSIEFATKIFVFITFGVAIIGAGVLLLVTNKFARPVIHMAEIAKRMANMDFDARVNVKTNDEYAELGCSMNEMSENLEKAISDLKVANAQLENDIQKKTEIDDMRKEFLSHVSHELKTPIALIQGYAEGLKDNISEDPEDMEFYCDVIIDEASKMNQLVKKLLNLNELEFGNTELDIERFNLNELITQIINSKSILAGEAKSEIIFTEADKEPVYVWADEFMIETVFTNYLTNAIHYVKENGKIVVSYEMLEDTVRVNVFNEGERIPSEDIDKLFIKFYKVDKARTREYGGSGIGLSIVAAAMNKHNKDYGVFNNENGVTFYFELDTKA